MATAIVWLCFGTKDIFKDPYSTVVFAEDGTLIGGHIAADQQWRFPLIEEVPEHFKLAIKTYEDQRFDSHIGVDIRAILRAAYGNIKSGKITSGASTLTMQTVRLSRKGMPRTIWQKLIEAAYAIRLELYTTKEELLQLYASHAPFGGNVVGLETACWRYFQKKPDDLSVAEAAMLAVLPNAPSLIHLDRNRDRLLQKRNALLGKMLENGSIDSLSYDLALIEKIPPKPYPLPRLAPHLTMSLHLNLKGNTRHQTTIRSDIQMQATEIAKYYHQSYQQTNIENLAILVMDTKSSAVLAYVGNAPNAASESSVDMIQARRSTGSILKPFLFASMVDEGMLNPKAWIKDIPVNINGFSPRNYDRSYKGVIPADDALAQSLNIPAVTMLQDYKVDRFLNRLKALGLTTFNQSADHYGLSLILGGGEASLWELTGAYASMGRILHRFTTEMSKYNHDDVSPPSILQTEYNAADQFRANILSAGAIYHTFKAMEAVHRPDQEGQWQSFSSSNRIAWKTGTSFGHRDAWAIGVTQKYTVGVWVGNADGESARGLVGVKKAAPILFNVFNSLPNDVYFAQPLDDLSPKEICSVTGHLASDHCLQKDTILTIDQVSETPICPYHKSIYLDDSGQQVYKDCTSSDPTYTSWLDIPTHEAFYYRKLNPTYRPLPDFSTECHKESNQKVLDFVYPGKGVQVYIPIDLDAKQEEVIVEATHQDAKARLFWHLNNQYLGKTEDFHSMSISVGSGTHELRILDEEGNYAIRKFDVVGSE